MKGSIVIETKECQECIAGDGTLCQKINESLVDVSFKSRRFTEYKDVYDRTQLE